MAVNEKYAHGGGLGPLVGGEVHLPAEGEAVQCLLSFPDSSLQYSSCDPVSITHGLGLLLTQLAATSVYRLVYTNIVSGTQEHIVSDNYSKHR